MNGYAVPGFTHRQINRFQVFSISPTGERRLAGALKTHEDAVQYMTARLTRMVPGWTLELVDLAA